MTIDGFKTYAGRHCETSATGSLLLHEGFQISEPMMLGLSQGFGFIYWKMNFMNLPFIGGRSKPFDLTRVLSSNLGISLEARETSSKKKAWANVAEFIDGGTPVGLQVDCYHLEHFRHSVHFAGHFIAVYGYDQDHAYVCDTGKRYKVSLENLERARFEKGPMSAKALSYTVKADAGTIPFKEIIPKATRTIAEGFLNPPLKNFGYLGIQKLGKDILKWLQRAPNPRADLAEQAEMMENAGTGGAVFRNLFRDFLFECLEYFPGDVHLKAGADSYAAAAANWTEIARLIRSAGNENESGHLERASELCLRTAQIEKEAMESLSKI